MIRTKTTRPAQSWYPQEDYNQREDAVPMSAYNNLRIDPARLFPGAPPHFGQPFLPHIFTVAGRYGVGAKTYAMSDKALTHSRVNAEIMRNELAISECIEARQLSTALLPWSIVPQDDALDERTKELLEKYKVVTGKSARWESEELAAKMTLILSRCPNPVRLFASLMEGIWYGRQGVQLFYQSARIAGIRNRVLTIDSWEPRHGDKLVFRYDDGTYRYDPKQVGIRVGPGYNTQKHFVDYAGVKRKKVEATQHGLAYWMDKTERDTVLLHRHLIEDGDFNRPIEAGNIHGVGIRSKIYYTWLAYAECLKLLMEYMERTALGIEIWRYPAHNPQAREATISAAKERGAPGRSTLLVPVVEGEQADMYGVEIVEPGLGGAQVLIDVLSRFYGHKIKRYILGQTLTSEAEATGLGSGVAEAHMATYADRVRFDSANLSETMTYQLVRVLQLLCFPGSEDVWLQFKFNTASPNMQQQLEAYMMAWNMGAEIRAEDMYAIIGAKRPTENDDVLINPAFQMPPPGMGPMDMGATDLQGTDEEAVAGSQDMSQQFHAYQGPPPITWQARYDARQGKHQYRDPADPSPDQAKAGNYKKGHCTVQGIPITIEHAAGQTRNGKKWSQLMKNPYGYIKRSEGRDGDHVDCFLGPNLDSEIVFVIDSEHPESKRFDEHKVVIGASSSKEAKKIFKGNYPDGWHCGPITKMTMDRFKVWLDKGDTKKRCAPQIEQYSAGDESEMPGKLPVLSGVEKSEQKGLFGDLPKEQKKQPKAPAPPSDETRNYIGVTEGYQDHPDFMHMEDVAPHGEPRAKALKNLATLMAIHNEYNNEELQRKRHDESAGKDKAKGIYRPPFKHEPMPGRDFKKEFEEIYNVEKIKHHIQSNPELKHKFQEASIAASSRTQDEYDNAMKHYIDEGKTEPYWFTRSQRNSFGMDDTHIPNNELLMQFERQAVFGTPEEAYGWSQGKDWGELQGFGPFPENLASDQRRVGRQEMTSNANYHRQLTRNEYKLLLGNDLVNKAIQSSYGPNKAWAQYHEAIDPSQKARLQGKARGGFESELTDQEREQLSHLGISPKEFWQDVRRGNVERIKKLAIPSMAKRRKFREGNRHVLPDDHPFQRASAEGQKTMFSAQCYREAYAAALDIAAEVEQYSAVGKKIGNAVYVHRDYVDQTPDHDRVVEADRQAGDFDWTIAKITPDNISLIQSPDFDQADEPVIGKSVLIKSDGSVKSRNAPAKPVIYHHKWQMVGDDYSGFDVDESKARSKAWTSVPGVDKSRIGSKEYWEKNVVPKIDQYMAHPHSQQDQSVANATSRSGGAVGGHPVTITYVKKYAKPGMKILDFGAGTKAAQAQELRAAGLNVTPYEFGKNFNAQVHDPKALDRQYDLIYASNVLNVQETPQDLKLTIQEIAESAKPGTVVIANLPSTPRKGAFNGVSPEQATQTIAGLFSQIGQVTTEGPSGSPVFIVQAGAPDQYSVDATERSFPPKQAQDSIHADADMDGPGFPMAPPKEKYAGQEQLSFNEGPAPHEDPVTGGRRADIDRPFTGTKFLTGSIGKASHQLADEHPHSFGMMVTPDTTSNLKHMDKYGHYAIDNGVFGGTYTPEKFDALLKSVSKIPGYRETALFATAPDEFDRTTMRGDALKTIAKSRPWFNRIREHGFPAAMVAQDGLEDHMDKIPWGEFDVLFIGGSDDFKLGQYQGDQKHRWDNLIKEARKRGKPIHVGRVNSEKRLKFAESIGADSADGNYLAFGPDRNVQKVRQWLENAKRRGQQRALGKTAQQEMFAAQSQLPFEEEQPQEPLPPLPEKPELTGVPQKDPQKTLDLDLEPRPRTERDEAKARTFRTGDDMKTKTSGGFIMVRAPQSGAVSQVNGRYYRPGELMPKPVWSPGQKHMTFRFEENEPETRYGTGDCLERETVNGEKACTITKHSFENTGWKGGGQHPNEAEMHLSSNLSKLMRSTYYDKDSGEYTSSRRKPQEHLNLEPGSWKVSDEFEGLHGRDIDQLVHLNPHELVLSEGDYTDMSLGNNPEGRRDDAMRYAQWVKDGKKMPPIDVVETPEGKMKVTNGHRRLAAAKLAGSETIPAWVSYTVESPDTPGAPTGLTDKLAKKYYGEKDQYGTECRSVADEHGNERLTYSARTKLRYDSLDPDLTDFQKHVLRFAADHYRTDQ